MKYTKVQSGRESISVSFCTFTCGVLLWFSFVNTASTTWEEETKVNMEPLMMMWTRRAKKGLYIGVKAGCFRHLVTVGHQQVEEPQSSQTNVLHTETSQTGLIRPPRADGAARRERAAGGDGPEGVQSLTESSQVELQQREEEDSPGTRPSQTRENESR